MAVVTLDQALFRELYPAYAGASDEAIAAWWAIVCQLVDNTDGSRIPYDPPNVTTRKPILYAALCHVAFTQTRDNGVVGRVSSAAQGSVNTGFDCPAANRQSAWWLQSQCGSLVWQMLKPWRSGGVYFPGGVKY